MNEEVDTEMVYSSEPMGYEESIKELITLLERKLEQAGWGDDQHPNAVMATVHVTDLGSDSRAFGVRAYMDLPEVMQADFPGALAVMAKQFLGRETELMNRKGAEVPGDDLQLMQNIDTSFIGWAVSFEAFTITSDDEDMDKYASERRIDQHPNRVEQRMVIFMGMDSTLITVIRTRGQSDDQVEATVVDGKKQTAEGTIHQSLRLINVASILSIIRRFGRDARGPLYDLIRGAK